MFPMATRELIEKPFNDAFLCQKVGIGPGISVCWDPFFARENLRLFVLLLKMLMKYGFKFNWAGNVDSNALRACPLVPGSFFQLTFSGSFFWKQTGIFFFKRKNALHVF